MTRNQVLGVPLACRIVGVACLLLAAMAAWSQQPPADAAAAQRFEIPAGPLDRALNAFARQAGWTLAVEGELTAGRQSDGLTGRFAPEQALRRLLQGTGLAARLDSAGSVTVIQAPVDESGEPILLDPIQVAGEGLGGFRANNSSSATNVNAALIETPATVNVITSDFIDAIGARRIEDIVQYVPGASAENQSGTGNTFNIRGFRVTTFGGGGNLDGGVRIDDNRIAARRYHFDPSLYDRVDVLKGSASLLYGTAAPGGIVRYVSKKPLFESHHRVEASAGSFETTRGTVDSTGPISDNIAYRFIATAQESNQSFHGDSDDSSFDDRVIINPQLIWLTPGGGEFRVSYEYSEHDNATDPGIKRLADGSFTFNTQPFLGPDSFLDRETQLGSVEFVQPISEYWQVTLGASIGRTDIDNLTDGAFLSPNASDQLNRTSSRSTEDSDHEEFRAEINGQFNTGSNIEHKITIGASHLVTDVTIGTDQLTASAPIDARNPVFGPAPTTVLFSRDTFIELEEKAIYLQDFISIGDKLKAFGGLRYTDADATVNVDIPAVNVSLRNTGSDDAVDYTIGAIYNQNHWLNPFVSYSTALTPQTGALAAGAAVPFQESEQIEVGLKNEWFDGGLATTLSIFEIEQTNIAEGDPENPGFLILAGDQRTRGLELESVGQITDQFRILGGYSYLDAAFTESAAGNEGNTPHSVPENKFSLFGEYAFVGDLDGWRAGVGFIHVGDREGDNANSFDLPSYERVDLSLAYQSGALDFRASIENVLNEDYIVGSDGVGDLSQGATRFFTLSVGYEF